MTELITRTQPQPNNFKYYWIGLIVLVLNKIRHTLQGYQTPRPFPISSIKTAIDYDFSVVSHWLKMYETYTGKKAELSGKTILELGPGADLGIGLITLLMGAKCYNAMDVHNLVKNVPREFYESFFEIAQAHAPPNVIEELRTQLALTQSGKNNRLNYVCRKDFDLSLFAGQGIDLIFSQAAFEHFDNIRRTFLQLSQVATSGAILVSEIDLNTHTRWLRDVDPLNIYRYSDTFYKLCKFRGSPNRLRPIEYKQTLEACGWEDVRIIPLTRVTDVYLAKVTNKLNRRFQPPENRIELLSVMLCAKKK